MVLVDMAWRLNPDVRVFTLDTGRLPPETYELFERVRDRYGIGGVRVPRDRHRGGDGDRARPEPDVRERRPPIRCCEVRKVEPPAKLARRSTRGWRACGGSSGGAAGTSPRSSWTGARRDREAEPGRRLDAWTACGTTCASTTSRTTPCSTRATRRSAARRARGPSLPASRSGPGAGGGQATDKEWDPLLRRSAGVGVGSGASSRGRFRGGGDELRLPGDAGAGRRGVAS